MPTSCWKTARCDAGFTLLEVAVSLVIISLVVVVLLGRRLEVVQEASWSRETRTAAMLAGQKMGELELDPVLWTGEGGAMEGNFEDVDPDYASYTWEYAAARERLAVGDPEDNPPTIKELFRMNLRVRSPGLEDPVEVEAYLPIREAKQ